MGEKLKNFGKELGKTFKSLGTATNKALKSFDTPEMRKLDEDMKKAMNGVE